MDGRTSLDIDLDLDGEGNGSGSGSGRNKNFGRPMLSRRQVSAIALLQSLRPGKTTPGCLVCCSSPTCCPSCAMLPCCDDAEYIRVKKEASKYVYIRENSLEWNQPRVVAKKGSCFGIDPCHYEIQDSVTVLYFDDPIFDRLSDQTRVCNECRTCCCGGNGERVQIDSPICFGLCLRGSAPCPCIPICCPTSLFPCVLKHEIYLEDAQKSLYEIKIARQSVLRNPTYNDTTPLEIVSIPASDRV